VESVGAAVRPAYRERCSAAGQLLNVGRELSQMSLVITSITLILGVGIAIELLLFAPLERRVLTRRGLTMH
jgi:NitT/TauT family transport system permease protein